MTTYIEKRFYPRYLYQFDDGFFVVYFHYERKVFEFPLIFAHMPNLSCIKHTISNIWEISAQSEMGLFGSIQTSRFTGNCGIRTLEFANFSTSKETVNRAVLWLRHELKLGIIVGSDYVNGAIGTLLKDWRKTRSIPNPNMGPIEGSGIHNIRLFWKDVHNLDTSEVDTWKAVPIPQQTEQASPPPGIFAGTSG